MLDFAEGRTDLLVATTVVEVGIDVANATMIVIEDADRFGLAQLHQLRGRVGRGEHPGCCLLFGEPADRGRRAPPRGAHPDAPTASAWPSWTWRSAGRGASWACARPGPTDLRFARLSRDRRELAEARHIAAPDPARPTRTSSARSTRCCAPPCCAASTPFRGCSTREDRRRHPPRAAHRRAAAGTATRPTADRVREALFSIIGPVEGLDVLDLFAGSGALGLEALSRGAALGHAGRARAARRSPCIRANVAALGLEDRVRVVAARLARRARGRAGRRPGLRVVPL